MFIPKKLPLWEIQKIVDIFDGNICCYNIYWPLSEFSVFSKLPTFKWPISELFKRLPELTYIHEQILDIGFKVMVVICIQTL
jgi:hypothetical protein